MNTHFFTAPFYFAFIWFRVQGSGFRVQGSGFRVQGSGLRWRLRRLFLLGRCPPVSFLPWDFIRVSLAFSSIVVYNKSSDCHCFFWRGILIL